MLLLPHTVKPLGVTPAEPGVYLNELSDSFAVSYSGRCRIISESEYRVRNRSVKAEGPSNPASLPLPSSRGSASGRDLALAQSASLTQMTKHSLLRY